MLKLFIRKIYLLLKLHIQCNSLLDAISILKINFEFRNHKTFLLIKFNITKFCLFIKFLNKIMQHFTTFLFIKTKNFVYKFNLICFT